MERIDRILSSRTTLSRKEIKELVKKKRISVNGAIVRDSSVKIEEGSEISLDGKSLNLPEHIYIMMNKPAGVICATEDKKEKTVIDLLPDELKRHGLFPAGRLDKDSEGFVLITDDGDFAHRILSPKNHISKTYVVTLERALSPKDIETLEKGAVLKDNTVCEPAKARMLSDENPTAEIIICEGKYHQIKRMIASVENKVITLKRVRMGGLELDKSLENGRCRILTPEETQNIEFGESVRDF
ncbi:MAG: rRNA pseudouridine synthase [Clostridiales bacterium]|nr:rRNA pseudouridine synthase [Clostridiales bacterium]